MRPFLYVFFIVLLVISTSAQNKYENHPISKVSINFGNGDQDTPAAEQYRTIARESLGATYSTPRVRDSIEAIYNKTKNVTLVTVSAEINQTGGVDLRYLIKRKTQVQKVSIVLGQIDGDPVTEQDLLFKLNLLTPGTAITEQVLRNNADDILDYLRERGFYKSEVVYEQHPLQNENEAGVTFKITPNEQAHVDIFRINIEGYATPIPPTLLKLRKGEIYSRERLTSDIAAIRDLLRKADFAVPQLDEPQVTYDRETNLISVELNGKVGPKIKVLVESEGKISRATQDKLIPIKRQGTLDYAAIVEGERRLEDYYQVQGYFFVKVTPLCAVDPALTDAEGIKLANNTEFLCSFLGGEDLINHAVEVKYQTDLGRRLRLADIRLRGTDKITIDDISTVLRSQKANPLGIVPILGYGRGYTSAAIIDEDTATVRSLMSELGYRDASVHVNQGVSPSGDDLIITFEVDEGPPTVIGGVSIVDNKAFTSDQLLAKLPLLTGVNFSRARMRNAARKLSEFYSEQGYYDARVVPSVTEPVTDAAADKKVVKIEFKIEDEGKKVVINRILVTGNDKTKTAAVLKALTLRTGELLRSADIYSSEQNLYGTDAFAKVEIKNRSAGDGPAGERMVDVIVSVEEQPARLLSYGGGFSTDLGFNGFFDIRHFNLFGNLWQGGARAKYSLRQQLVQFDFIDPRFLHDGKKQFAPLTISALYQRDSTVTRFFRSAFDSGTFGIVQRLDDKGNPIDEFGRNAGSPTINRISFSAETSRTISRPGRSIAFFRYRFEDVRLTNVESLLIKDLVRPDARVRISGFNLTFARDTRQKCTTQTSLLDLIAKGEPGEPCRYNASDPTRGYYLTADYNISLPVLGANFGFHKFQGSINYYRTFSQLKSTTLAARAIIGLASVFSGGNRFDPIQFPGLNGILPISERFFAGGSDTLRGFDFEEAGPRVVIVPTGTFRDSGGKQVFLNPFTIPFGGNALAVVNIEARTPLTKSLRAVPFYDGGNVFRRIGDIFSRPNIAPGDVVGQNLNARWTHTIGLGLRLKTPVGGEFAVDYGYLLNPPRFLIPQPAGPNAIFQLPRGHFHFRFSQAF